MPESEIIPKLWTYSILRGGFDKTGSMIWSDVRELDRESTYFQIFGHTQLESLPIITKDWACVDCRKLITINSDKQFELL